MKTLEERIRKLEDIDEIKQLKARYAAACDNNYDADTITVMFTEDGVFDAGELGKAEGREELRAFFRRVPESTSFALHYILNAIIEVDGDRATGKWYLLQPTTLIKGNQAIWFAATYDDEYKRVEGKWRFRRVNVTPHFRSPYDEGWSKKRFI
jgi:ketosteroid isomerase-like protein